MALAIFGENHITSTQTNSASACVGTDEAGRRIGAYSASVPRTSSPIQAGEPMNIKIANTKLIAAYRLEAREAKETANTACCLGTSADRGG